MVLVLCAPEGVAEREPCVLVGEACVKNPDRNSCNSMPSEIAPFEPSLASAGGSGHGGALPFLSGTQQTVGPQSEEWEPVRIRTAGGVCLSGLLGEPRQTRRKALQAVVLVHGFAAEKTENGLFLEAGERLLRAGHTVFMYDWRGLGESEGDFSRTTLREHTADFRTVVDWLGRKNGVASTRLCAVGFSLGAALVAQAIKNGLALGASSFWSPAVRPRLSMWPRYDTQQLRDELRSKGFIVKPENKVRLGASILRSLQETDLGKSAFSLGVPLLVCHGTDDSRIPIEHTRQVFSCCRNEPVIYAEFTGATHSFRPTQEQRSGLYDLFLHWLSDEAFRAQRQQIRMPQDWRPAPLAPASDSQTARGAGL